MPPAIPWYITLIVVGTNVTIAIVLWNMLSAAASRSGLPRAAQRRVRIGVVSILGAWLAAAFVIAPALGTRFAGDRIAVPPIVVFSMAVLGVALLLLMLSPSARRALAVLPLPMAIGVQVYRAIGAVFIVLLAQDKLPAHFALPAGWGDVGIGLAAPLVALALARGLAGSRALGIAWNVLGLVDLVVAVGMGSGLLVPLFAPDIGHAPPAVAMQFFPMVLVPAFAVPVSIALHFIALTKLAREGRVTSGLVPKAAS